MPTYIHILHSHLEFTGTLQAERHHSGVGIVTYLVGIVNFVGKHLQKVCGRRGHVDREQSKPVHNGVKDKSFQFGTAEFCLIAPVPVGEPDLVVEDQVRRKLLRNSNFDLGKGKDIVIRNKVGGRTTTLYKHNI